MKFGALLSGLFWILIGIAILGVNCHWWSSDIWYQILALWPLILVVIGIRLMLGDENPITFFLCILIILLGVGFVSNYHGVREKYLPMPKSHEQRSEKPVGDYKDAKILVNIGAADVKISSLPVTNMNLYDFNFKSESDMKVEDKSSEEVADIVLNEKQSSSFYRFSERSLDLKLTELIPIKLNVNSGATNLNIDLSNLKVTNLGINCGASSGNIKIGNKEKKVKFDLNTGASDFKILLPRDYGISIESKAALSAESYESLGLEKSGQTYKSKGFDQNEKQITITISAGVSSFDITTY